MDTSRVCLLAALADSRQEIRSQAVEQILRIRHDERTKKLAEEEQLRLKKEKNAHSKDRVFIKPAPNYGANDYIKFKGESENILIYEPPFTKSKTEDQLREFIGEK